MIRNNTVKNILSVVFGLIACFIIIFIQLIIEQIIYPLPANLDLSNTEAVRQYTDAAPPVILVLIIIFYSLGSFTGAFVAAMIAASNKMTNAITVGGILIGFGAYNKFMIPHPVWTIAVSIFVFIPSSYFGGYSGIKMSSRRKLKAQQVHTRG